MTSGEGAKTQPGSQSIMIPALRISELSPTTGPIGKKISIAKVPLVQVSSSSSKGDDHDIGSEPAPHDASKFSHLIEKEMQAATPETESLSMKTATTKGILSFSHGYSYWINNILTSLG